MRRVALTLLAGAALLSACCPPALAFDPPAAATDTATPSETSATAANFEARFESAWGLVAERYWDLDSLSVDWDEVGRRYRERLLEVEGEAELYSLLESMYEELGDNHSVYVPPARVAEIRESYGDLPCVAVFDSSAALPRESVLAALRAQVPAIVDSRSSGPVEYGLTAAGTGANQATLHSAGIEHEVVHLHPAHHAGYFPGAEQVHLVASFAPDGRLLGAQAVGRAGVDKRIDVLATAIRAGMGADDLAELELAYAPPYGSAKDPVNMLGFVAQNVLDGTMPQWQAWDLDQARAHTLVLDVRSAAEYESGHLDGALHVPHTELRHRLDEVRAAAAGRPVSVHCASGVRSYLATRILRGEGVDARNLSGGWLTLQAVHPDAVRQPAMTTA